MGFFFDDSKKETCSICGEKFISCYRLKDKNKICKNCIKKLGGFWKSNWVNMTQEEALKSLNKQNLPKDSEIEYVSPNSMKKYDDIKKSILYDENTDWGKRNIERDRIEHERFLLQEKYEKMIQEHYQYEENVEENYKLAIYQDNINNKYTEKCKEQCELDIKLSESLIPYYEKDIELQNKAYNFGIVGLPIYSSYTRLTQIYEKQKDFMHAIKICNIAIKNGYINEGGNKTVIIRKARLENRLKKHLDTINKKNNTNYKYYPDKSLIIDDNTGEIIE